MSALTDLALAEARDKVANDPDEAVRIVAAALVSTLRADRVIATGSAPVAATATYYVVDDVGQTTVFTTLASGDDALAAVAALHEETGKVAGVPIAQMAERERERRAVDWTGRTKDPAVEELRALTVDQCGGCGPGGESVRTCPIHGLGGTAPR